MKINRCPKCGRKPIIFSKATVSEAFILENIKVEAKCYDCGLHTGDCSTRDEAVEKWNEMTGGETK
jgi:hypothetical protein